MISIPMDKIRAEFNKFAPKNVFLEHWFYENVKADLSCC